MQVQALVDDARRGGFPTLMGADITQVYYLGDAATPVYAGGRECQLLAMAEAAAAAAAEHWAQTFLRLALQTQGQVLFTLRMFNPDMAGLAHLIASRQPPAASRQPPAA